MTKFDNFIPATTPFSKTAPAPKVVQVKDPDDVDIVREV